VSGGGGGAGWELDFGFGVCAGGAEKDRRAQKRWWSILNQRLKGEPPPPSPVSLLIRFKMSAGLRWLRSLSSSLLLSSSPRFTKRCLGSQREFTQQIVLPVRPSTTATPDNTTPIEHNIAFDKHACAPDAYRHWKQRTRVFVSISERVVARTQLSLA